MEVVEGFTEPYRSVDISLGEPGVVTMVNVEPGDTVKAGDILLALDTSVLQATLAVAREKAEVTGNVAAARAEVDLRTERLQQIQLLRERGHATQRELRRADTDLAIAAARLQLAEEERQLNELDCKRIEAQIARRRAQSPYAGLVVEVHREIGESLLVTDPRVVTLVQLDRLRTRFAATPKQASTLKVGQTVQIALEDDDQDASGKVERISPIVDAGSGTVEVLVLIENPNQRVRSGTRCLLKLNPTLPSEETPARREDVWKP